MKTEEQTKTEIEFTEKASSRYRDTLEKFKNRLALDPSSSLREFCHEVHVDYNGMKSWYSHHNVSIRNLRKEAEQIRLQDSQESQSKFVQVRPAAVPQHLNGQDCHPAMLQPSMLKGVSITFPEGIVMSMSEIGVREVVGLLHAYCDINGGSVPCSD